MVAVITAALAGFSANLICIVASDHSLAAALISGTLVAVAALQPDAFPEPSSRGPTQLMIATAARTSSALSAA
jgi:hypothetical protein